MNRQHSLEPAAQPVTRPVTRPDADAPACPGTRLTTDPNVQTAGRTSARRAARLTPGRPRPRARAGSRGRSRRPRACRTHPLLPTCKTGRAYGRRRRPARDTGASGLRWRRRSLGESPSSRSPPARVRFGDVSRSRIKSFHCLKTGVTKIHLKCLSRVVA